MTDKLEKALGLHEIPECLAAMIREEIREQVAEAYARGRADATAERLFRGTDLQRVSELILAEAKRQRPGAEIRGIEIVRKKP
jgi:hypothetical protein